MCRIFVFLLFLMIFNNDFLSAQTAEGVPVKSFGLHVADAVTCSGHGTSTNMALSMQNNRRELSLGAIYENEHNKITGAEMQYRVFLGKKSTSIGKRRVNPYMYYNFIYRSSEPNFIDDTQDVSEIFPVTEGAVISSLEHFAGIGFSFRLFGGLFVDAAGGGGLYMGSINKDLKVMENLGVHNENGGYGFAGRIGISYRFAIDPLK